MIETPGAKNMTRIRRQSSIPDPGVVVLGVLKPSSVVDTINCDVNVLKVSKITLVEQSH